MISKNKIKYIRGLEQKKNRKAEGCFVAEGHKVVGDLMAAGMMPRMIVATEEWLHLHCSLPSGIDVTEVTEDELRKVSFLQHPQQVIGVFPIPADEGAEMQGPQYESSWFLDNLCLALDSVQDPGNMGTIIRLADWFGIDTIFCSHGTVDAYSPKVVQATMGSIARVRVVYTDLVNLISSFNGKVPVYGTLLDGENIYSQTLTPYGMIVMGNEGNGISAEVRTLVNNRLLIPNFPEGRSTAESLNVAIATAVVCSEFRRPK